MTILCQESISSAEARRLALARAGLLKPEWVKPTAAAGSSPSLRQQAHAWMAHFGYLQLDTVSVAGARTHSIVLQSRIPQMTPLAAESLLQPDEPVFEYWGHEASWLPLELYPLFAFRRRRFRSHPWWGNIISSHPKVVKDLKARFRNEGPLRSAEIGGGTKGGWWQHGPAKKVAAALWSSGELAIRERKNFQRTFDLSSRVIPASLRKLRVSQAEAYRRLLPLALNGHGWATTNTLASTWRLRLQDGRVRKALLELQAEGEVVACTLHHEDGKTRDGWIRPEDLHLAARLRRVRPRADQGVLLSPFDPLLWDRARVLELFGFEQVLEIYKPRAQRKYGYYCLPVLAGESLVARVDLKADKKNGKLQVLSEHFGGFGGERSNACTRTALNAALDRYGQQLQLKWVKP